LPYAAVMHRSGFRSDIALIKSGSDALSGISTGILESFAILCTGDGLADTFLAIVFGGLVTTKATSNVLESTQNVIWFALSGKTTTC
jgi:hypothetical protein